jgi:hypothetical protein
MDRHAAGMILSGFTVAVLVPATILATRSSALWRAVSVPAAVALPAFLLLHAFVVFAGAVHPSTSLRLLLESGLVTAAFTFWLPVVGDRHRLSDPSRCVYLFLAAPLLDLPAVMMIAMGHTVGGLGMIVSMLPIGLTAFAATWRWVTTEEALAGGGCGPSGGSRTA